MKRLKVGVIGCGVMGGFHLKQYLSIPEIDVVGVSDIDPSRAPQGVKFFNDHKQLFGITDAVSVTSPTSTHYDVAIDALNAGCHVLIEKPITLTSDKAKILIKKAGASKLTLAVGHIESYNPAFKALMKQLGSNRPELIDIRRLSPFPERIGDASVVIDMMIHDIDLASRIARSQARHVNAIGSIVRSGKLDSAFAVIVFKNGVIANIEASRVNNEKVRKVIVSSKKTIIEADLLTKALKTHKNGKTNDVKVEQYDQLNRELRDFIGAILEKKKPSVTGADGLAALELAEIIEKAAIGKC